MKSLIFVAFTLVLSISSHAGILCTDTNQGIEEFYLGYSQLKGCYMTLERTGDNGRVSMTNLLNAGTPSEKYDCSESVVDGNVITEAKVNYDPSVLEPNESYPDFTLKVRGGVKNLSLTVILGPGFEWTLTNMNCQQVPDLESSSKSYVPVSTSWMGT